MMLLSVITAFSTAFRIACFVLFQYFTQKLIFKGRCLLSFYLSISMYLLNWFVLKIQSLVMSYKRHLISKFYKKNNRLRKIISFNDIECEVLILYDM